MVTVFLEIKSSNKYEQEKKLPIKWVKPTDTPQFTEANSNEFFITYPPVKRENNQTKPSKSIHYDYSKLRENQAFGKRFAGKYLAYKLLSSFIPKSIMPVDFLEVEMFYKENFTDTPENVFKRYCKYHDLEYEDTLNLYKSSLKWNQICTPNIAQDLTIEMESLSDCFFRILS